MNSEIDVDKELTDRLIAIADDMQNIFLKEKSMPSYEFYRKLDDLASNYGITGVHISGPIGKKIRELLNLMKVNGLKEEYFILAGQEPNKYTQKDIEEFSKHSKAIEELVDAEFKRNSRIKSGLDNGEDVIRQLTEKYCWEKFGNPSVDRTTNNQGNYDESRRIGRLAFRLYLPFYNSMRTVGRVKGQSYTPKQLKTALNKVKIVAKR